MIAEGEGKLFDRSRIRMFSVTERVSNMPLPSADGLAAGAGRLAYYLRWVTGSFGRRWG
jgi:hypothetical protein